MGALGAGVREVKSAARTIELLEFLAARYGTATRLRDVAEGLGTPRSSAYALLQTLVARGWVETDPTGADYSIGIRALLAGTSYIDRDPCVRLVQPILVDAAHELRETMHIALGKAVLSTRPDTALGSLPEPLTPGSLTSLKAARADLELTRTRGYATDNEENTPGLRCFGVALRYSTPVRDSISCSIPIERLTPARERTIIDTLLTIRERIEWSAPVDAVR